MNSDLDNLKKGWSAFKNISENDETHTKSQLEEILKKDSNQISQRFRKLLWKEAILSIAFTIFFGVLVLTTQNSSPLLWAIMLLIYIVNSIWLVNVLYKFPTPKKIESSLDNSLEEQIKIAKKFIKIYIKSNIILAAPCTLIGFLAGIQFTKDKNLLLYFEELIQNENYTKLSIYISVAIVLAVCITFFIKKAILWYVKENYGKYLEKLNVLKAQLSE
ncbi:hypothetical protein [Bernardetia sp. MNP-M8]|uniref:hypothetical protein n=1 Tax=Bernardetia sp. MNP-M8 TaxID=3127470 RepID=UPI0030D5E307